MRRIRFDEKQIIRILKEKEGGSERPMRAASMGTEVPPSDQLDALVFRH